MLINKSFGHIKITVDTKGAELKNLIKNDRDFMWIADSKYWGKTSPVLFPFVGGSKDNKYKYKGQEYEAAMHGFARDNEFTLVEEGEKNLKFLYKSDQNSLKLYPFNFEFYLNYVITNDGVNIEYLIVNKEDGDMYFSLGAHPAFIADRYPIEDYYLEFSEEENLSLYTLEGMFVGRNTKTYLDKNRKINLNKDIFNNDALIFNNPKSDYISLKNINDSEEIKVSLKEFPWLGIWSPPGAPFVCIEPWCGLADFVDHNGELTEKDGVNKLGKSEKFERVMEIIVKN